MKRIYLSFIILFMVFAPTFSFAQRWAWAKQVNHNVNQNYFGCVDDSGYYYGCARWPLTITKIDTSGNSVWSITDDSLSMNTPLSLVADHQGNLYLYGKFDSFVTFRGNTIIAPKKGRFQHYFLAKFDQNGNIIWLKRVGDVIDGSSVNNWAELNSLVLDKGGNLLIGGNFGLNGTIGTYPLVNSNTDTTGDIFLAKYTSNGVLEWVKSYGGKDYDELTGLSICDNGNIYIAGNTLSDTFKVGTASLIGLAHGFWHSGSGTFLCRLDSTGNPIWVKGLTDSNYTVCDGISTDTSENVFVRMSYFRSRLKLDSLTFPAPNVWGLSNLVLAKYNKDGHILWGKLAKGGAMQSLNSMVDKFQNVWLLVGSYSGYAFLYKDTIDGVVIDAVAQDSSVFCGQRFFARWNSDGCLLSTEVFQSEDCAFGVFKYNICLNRYNQLFFIGGLDCDSMIIGHDTLTNPYGVQYVARYDPDMNAKCIKARVDDVISKDDRLLVFPNPCDGEVSFLAGYPIRKVAIYNITGQLVFLEYYRDNQTIAKIGVENFPPGIYVGKVNDLVVVKFLKE